MARTKECRKCGGDGWIRGVTHDRLCTCGVFRGGKAMPKRNEEAVAYRFSRMRIDRALEAQQ